MAFALGFLPASAQQITAQPSPARLKELDEYARTTPERVEHSIDTLTAYLTIPAADEYERARLIYSWIAQHIKYDDGAINSNRVSDYSTSQVLRKKKAVCFGFATLFEAMCFESGLNARTIIGFAKPEKRGAHLKNPDHAWNAVQVDGHWILCDATWGYGYAVRHGKRIKTKKDYSDFWFDTPAFTFSLTHLPEIGHWQLVNPHMTRDQFSAIPLIYPDYFEHGFVADSMKLEVMADKKFKPVKLFHTKGCWTQSGAPWSKNLSRNQTYRFDIQTNDYDFAVVVADGLSMRFEAKSGAIPLEFTPGKRNLILLFHADKPKSGEVILEYSAQ